MSFHSFIFHADKFLPFYTPPTAPPAPAPPSLLRFKKPSSIVMLISQALRLSASDLLLVFWRLLLTVVLAAVQFQRHLSLLLPNSHSVLRTVCLVERGGTFGLLPSKFADLAYRLCGALTLLLRSSKTLTPPLDLSMHWSSPTACAGRTQLRHRSPLPSNTSNDVLLPFFLRRNTSHTSILDFARSHTGHVALSCSADPMAIAGRTTITETCNNQGEKANTETQNTNTELKSHCLTTATTCPRRVASCAKKGLRVHPARSSCLGDSSECLVRPNSSRVHRSVPSSLQPSTAFSRFGACPTASPARVDCLCVWAPPPHRRFIMCTVHPSSMSRSFTPSTLSISLALSALRLRTHLRPDHQHDISKRLKLVETTRIVVLLFRRPQPKLHNIDKLFLTRPASCCRHHPSFFFLWCACDQETVTW